MASSPTDSKRLEFEHMYVTSGPDGRSWVYDVQRLWRLADELEVGEAPLSEFDALLDEPHSWGGAPTNRDVARHARRIYDADLAYPVLQFAEGTVVDGHHRVLKAWLLGHSTVKVRRFRIDPEPDGVR